MLTDAWQYFMTGSLKSGFLGCQKTDIASFLPRGTYTSKTRARRLWPKSILTMSICSGVTREKEALKKEVGAELSMKKPLPGTNKTCARVWKISEHTTEGKLKKMHKNGVLLWGGIF